MSARQIDIAKEVGLDVSSVNKILNKVPGPVFRKDTIKRVFKAAKLAGYDLNRENKHSLRRRVQFLEKVLEANELAIQALRKVCLRCIPEEQLNREMALAMKDELLGTQAQRTA